MRMESLKILFSAEDIDRRVQSIADQLNTAYAGKQVAMLCVLTGAFMFFSDLLKYVKFFPQIDFVRIASYGSGTTSCGKAELLQAPRIPLAGKDVVVVEDIIDSGTSMAFLVEYLRAQNVKSLRIAALIDKIERREHSVTVDYSGFRLLSGFVVGYGLDYDERYRELPALYTVEFEDQA